MTSQARIVFRSIPAWSSWQGSCDDQVCSCGERRHAGGTALGPIDPDAPEEENELCERSFGPRPQRTLPVFSPLAADVDERVRANAGLADRPRRVAWLRRRARRYCRGRGGGRVRSGPSASGGSLSSVFISVLLSQPIGCGVAFEAMARILGSTRDVRGRGWRRSGRRSGSPTGAGCGSARSSPGYGRTVARAGP